MREHVGWLDAPSPIFSKPSTLDPLRISPCRAPRALITTSTYPLRFLLEDDGSSLTYPLYVCEELGRAHIGLAGREGRAGADSLDRTRDLRAFASNPPPPERVAGVGQVVDAGDLDRVEGPGLLRPLPPRRSLNRAHLAPGSSRETTASPTFKRPFCTVTLAICAAADLLAGLESRRPAGISGLALCRGCRPVAVASPAAPGCPLPLERRGSHITGSAPHPRPRPRPESSS